MSTTLAEPSADLRYPIGRFKPPVPITQQHVSEAVAEIAALPRNLRSAVACLTEAQTATAYRPGGWTVAQLVHHIADSHLNSYVRFKLALTEKSPHIKPYDQDAWAELPDAKNTLIEPSLNLIEGLHVRWIEVLQALSSEDYSRTFIHPEFPDRSLTLAWATLLYGWHSRHHVTQIVNLRSREGW